MLILCALRSFASIKNTQAKKSHKGYKVDVFRKYFLLHVILVPLLRLKKKRFMLAKIFQKNVSKALFLEYENPRSFSLINAALEKNIHGIHKIW